MQNKPSFKQFSVMQKGYYVSVIIFFCLILEIYAKVKSNSLIQAEPSVLHFSGFELGKDYLKTLVRKILLRFEYLWCFYNKLFQFPTYKHRINSLPCTMTGQVDVFDIKVCGGALLFIITLLC